MSLNIDAARELMIEQQLRAGSVLDQRVLDALASVPREQFVPHDYRNLAFADEHIPLACGQTMMTPLQEGLVLQALSLRPMDHVLEIGTGSGYLTACLAKLAAQVTTVEVFPELADAARKRLEKMQFVNCDVVLANVFEMEMHRADVIAVTGSLPMDDERFAGWLQPGGRLFQIVGDSLPMSAWRIERLADAQYSRARLFETALPPLLHAPTPDPFIF